MALEPDETETMVAALFASTLFVGLFAEGGLACAQHIALRSVLYLHGQIPRDYADFLDYAAKRLFVQRVGGGYIFVHRLLLEHFAEID
ncbi:MAG: hypothetical protein MJA27_21210 [Pseudanabaenales cyanobacterium]|nr:hypothetical protein [Pseudanabaenales cyanobacterium]